MAIDEATLVVGVYAVMVLTNGLANARAFGGKDNKTISDQHPTYVTPDALTFAVWGLVYTLLLVLVVVQALRADRTEELLRARCPVTGLNVRQRLICAFLANSLWLPLFNNEKFWAALGAMTVYLAALVSIYSDLNVEPTRSPVEAVTLTAGIALNTSWILVAFMLNAFLCCGTAGWQDVHGVAGTVPAAGAVVLGITLLGCERAIRGGDLAWAFVAAWAARGIFRMQTVPDNSRFPVAAMSASLGSVARACSLVLTAVIVAQAGLWAWRHAAAAKAEV